MQWEQSVIKIRGSKGGNLCALFRKVVPCSYRAHVSELLGDLLELLLDSNSWVLRFYQFIIICTGQNRKEK